MIKILPLNILAVHLSVKRIQKGVYVDNFKNRQLNRVGLTYDEKEETSNDVAKYRKKQISKNTKIYIRSNIFYIERSGFKINVNLNDYTKENKYKVIQLLSDCLDQNNHIITSYFSKIKLEYKKIRGYLIDIVRDYTSVKLSRSGKIDINIPDSIFYYVENDCKKYGFDEKEILKYLKEYYNDIKYELQKSSIRYNNALEEINQKNKEEKEELEKIESEKNINQGKDKKKKK